MPLHITSSPDGRTHAGLDGELTISTIEELKDELFGLLNAQDVALDLSQVTEYDGCGLQTLALLLTEAAATERVLRLDPPHDAIAHSMKLLGFSAIPAADTGSSHGPDKGADDLL